MIQELIIEDFSFSYLNDFFKTEMNRIHSIETPDYLPYFRGLDNKCYSLICTLERKRDKTKNMFESFENMVVEKFRNEKQILIENNILVSEAYKDKHHNTWHMLSQLQHLEIPTRLMDWSSKWQVALFFSLGDNNYDGAVWTLKIPILKQVNYTQLNSLNPLEVDDYFLINEDINLGDEDSYVKRIAERRRNRQQGKFIVQSNSNSIIGMEVNTLYKDLLQKIIIPKELKEKIKEELQKEGVTKEWLMVEEKNIFVEEMKSKF